jgi:DUF917 family protein
MREITADDLPDIARGAAVLGTGGGGDPYIGRKTATHTVSIEAGGLNSVIPFATAAELGLPVVDADGMGRAFPEIQMPMPTLGGISATPMAIADECGNALSLTALDNTWAERFARTATIEMGCSCAVSLYALTGRQTKEFMVHGTISLTQRIGVAIREAAAAHRDPVAATAEVLGGHRIFQGKLVDVRRGTEGGFSRGDVRLEGLGADLGAHLDVAIQNENLVATRDGVVLASVPDLICVLDTDTGEPVTTEMLRYGLRVSVVVAPCDPRWRSPEGLALTGPSYFCYDHEYVPV